LVPRGHRVVIEPWPALKSFGSDNRSHGCDWAFLRPPARPSERYESATSLHPILHQGNLARMRMFVS
jgi:hypothetical protein